jgi:hypothetical protein
MQIKEIIAGFLILMSLAANAENQPANRKKERKVPPVDSIRVSIDYLRKYFNQESGWKAVNPEVQRTLFELVHYAEDEPIDSVVLKMNRFQKSDTLLYYTRPVDRVSDSLQVQGYLPQSAIREQMKKLNRAVWSGVDMKSIPLPEDLQLRVKKKKIPIAPGDEKAILAKTGLVLPDSLKSLQVIPDSLMKTAADFARMRRREDVRNRLLEDARMNYNQQARRENPDSLVNAYRREVLSLYADSLTNHLRDSLKLRNAQILAAYNNTVVRQVNDSIDRYIRTLQRLAENDSVAVSFENGTGSRANLWLRRANPSAVRLFIHNEQNDSLGIRLTNLDKHLVKISIDDDVLLNRAGEKQRRDFKFERPELDQGKLTKISKQYQVLTPWNIGGNGSFGATQTYLNNWKAGGNSAFSLLTVLKGYANYSNDKIKWENSGEFRNGWVRQGGSVNQTQKNDDKIELISNFGVSAFKQWYYSAGVDFTTQFFKGYNYPDKTKPISAYMSPAKTLFKVGLDYKPNKNFSLFLSPLTAKNVFVRDTAMVDQTRFGIDAKKRSFWEPGLNADLSYRFTLTPLVTVETKYKMFVNYLDPFRKIDLDWENNMIARITDRINMTFMVHWLYDSNVTFPTGKYQADGSEIYKPKLQTRELMTIGFSYKLDRHLYKRQRID